jgi:hypothetical protein
MPEGNNLPMSSIYKMDEPRPDKKELAGARQDAKDLLRIWKKRALYATTAFFLSCASVSPFLYGHSLHIYWDSFGKYLVFLSMALLIPFVVSVGLAINSWIFLRNVTRGRI